MENQGTTNNAQPIMSPPSSGNMNQILPNSTGILVMGILSIVFCWCWGIIGITLGIISLSLACKSMKLYAEHPELYSEGSLKNTKAGKTCAIIGLCISGLYVIAIIIYLVFIGAVITSLPWGDFVSNLQ
jgi:hypothetical protein